MQIMDTPVEGETGDDAEAAIEKLEKELEDLEAIMSELKEKEDEIKQAIKEHASMKQALMSAMQAFAQAEKGSKGKAAAAPAAANPLQALSGNAPLATGSASAAAGPVQDLGVAGRGRTRITLQPVNAPNTTNAAPGAQAAAKTAPAKRSLEDIMGGGAQGGVTTIGFGGSALGGAAGGPDIAKLDAMMAKRMRTDAPAAAPAPGAENSGEPKPASS